MEGSHASLLQISGSYIYVFILSFPCHEIFLLNYLISLPSELMVSINIRVSTQEIWRYRKQKLGSSYSPHSFIYRGCLGWILPDCVLCSHKDRGGGERESPLPSKMVSHSTHGAAVCFFHTTSKTFPRSAHMFVVLFFFFTFFSFIF